MTVKLFEVSLLHGILAIIDLLVISEGKFAEVNALVVFQLVLVVDLDF